MSRRSISRATPSTIWSDHGTNFIGAAEDLKELYKFLNQTETTDSISNFCAEQNINWRFIPESVRHFGGLREAAVKSYRYHFKRIVGNVRLTYEELATILAQTEACLNSRPLARLPDTEDGLEVFNAWSLPYWRPLRGVA